MGQFSWLLCWLVKSKSGSLRTIQYCLDEKFTRRSNTPTSFTRPCSKCCQSRSRQVLFLTSLNYSSWLSNGVSFYMHKIPQSDCIRLFSQSRKSKSKELERNWFGNLYFHSLGGLALDNSWYACNCLLGEWSHAKSSRLVYSDVYFVYFFVAFDCRE